MVGQPCVTGRGHYGTRLPQHALNPISHTNVTHPQPTCVQLHLSTGLGGRPGRHLPFHPTNTKPSQFPASISLCAIVFSPAVPLPRKVSVIIVQTITRHFRAPYPLPLRFSLIPRNMTVGQRDSQDNRMASCALPRSGLHSGPNKRIPYRGI